jgi:hypothetical protein
MYKYRAIASFHIWPQISKAAMDATRRLVEAKGAASLTPNFDQFWKDFESFVRFKHADGKTEELILSPVTVEMRYDIPQWIADGMPLDTIEDYRLSKPEQFEFALSEEGARELRAALKVWTSNLKGMTKMVTRIRMAWQVRQATQQSSGNKFHMTAAADAGTGLLPESW